MDKDTAATQDQVPQLLCRTGHEREDGDQEVYQAKELGDFEPPRARE